MLQQADDLFALLIVLFAVVAFAYQLRGAGAFALNVAHKFAHYMSSVVGGLVVSGFVLPDTYQVNASTSDESTITFDDIITFLQEWPLSPEELAQVLALLRREQDGSFVFAGKNELLKLAGGTRGDVSRAIDEVRPAPLPTPQASKQEQGQEQVATPQASNQEQEQVRKPARHLDISDEDREQVRREAERQGVTVSQYLRLNTTKPLCVPTITRNKV